MNFQIIENEGSQKLRFLTSVAEKAMEGLFQHPVKKYKPKQNRRFPDYL